MNNIRFYIELILCGFLLFNITFLAAQESIIKDFAEDRNVIKVCFYPSTLRMINIKNDPAFDELVSDIDKLLIYKLDSIIAKDSFHWIEEYKKNGFEEYLSVQGITNLKIFGKEHEVTGFSYSGETMTVFYLRGRVALQKIPELISTFESSELLNMIIDPFK